MRAIWLAWLITSLALATAVCPARATPTLTISWDQPEQPEARVVRWRVYRAPAATGPWSLLKTVSAPTARVEVPAGEARWFRIRGVDEIGQVSPESPRLGITINVEVLP